MVLGLSLALIGYAALAEIPEARPDPSAKETAIFAGGCFWCMEPPFDALDGVLSTTSGYIGGDTSKPSYKQVSAGGSGHAEAVRVIYDPTKISYAALLDVYWRNIDPLAVDRQFCDIGDQYRSAIFAHDDEQEKLARASREAIASSGKLEGRIVTEIVKDGEFWPAEEYHQNYYQKNPVRYKYYRYSCGRDRRLAEIWGDAA
jgi:peptide-methionine (S)-S-oxide reductase